MTNAETIEQLQAFIDYFREERDAEPVCLQAAITKIEELERLQGEAVAMIAPAVEAVVRTINNPEFIQLCEKTLAARPRGTWKVNGTMYRGGKISSRDYRCSLCRRRIVYIAIDGGKTEEQFLAEYPFCHCGADMRPIVDPVETWNGIHGRATAPAGTFERIYNEGRGDED